MSVFNTDHNGENPHTITDNEKPSEEEVLGATSCQVAIKASFKVKTIESN